MSHVHYTVCVFLLIVAVIRSKSLHSGYLTRRRYIIFLSGHFLIKIWIHLTNAEINGKFFFFNLLYRVAPVMALIGCERCGRTGHPLNNIKKMAPFTQDIVLPYKHSRGIHVHVESPKAMIFFF